MVHDRVELLGQLRVDRGDRLVDGARQVAVEGDGARQGLLDQRLDQILGAIGLGLLGGADDLIEQVDASSVVVAAAAAGVGACASDMDQPSCLLEAELARQ